MMRAGSINWRVGSRQTISTTSLESGAGSWVVDVKDGATPCPMSLEKDYEASCSVSSDMSTISGGVGDTGSGGMEAEGAGVIGLGAVGAEGVVGRGAPGVEGEGGDDIIIAT